MGLFDFFKSHGKKGPVQDEEAQREPIGLEVYSHMRVEVTTPEGDLLFVAKLVNLRERTAELQQFSESALSQETEESDEPIPVHIRGYNDHERKAVYLEGLITPKPKHIWQVEQLVLVKVENARAFFRLDTNLDATATTFGGPNAGEKPCRLLNISVGGACIASEFQYREKDKFLLTVKLFEDREVSAMFCQVLRIISRGEDKYEYGCQFLELNENDQEKITQNIFAAQRKMRGFSR